MLLKLGVSIERLNREIRRALNPIESIYATNGEEAVLTSADGSTHNVGSLHYANDAVDVRMPKKNAGEVAQELRRRLGKDFDVVVEFDHVHVEFDPK